MDVIDPIMSLASEIYDLVERVKANKKRCHRLGTRVKGLERVVKSIRERKEIPKNVKVGLKDLRTTLKSARSIVTKYTTSSWIKLVLKSGSYAEEFDYVNTGLNDAFQVLSGNLQVQLWEEVSHLFKESDREKEDEVDGREDDNELQTLLMAFQKEQQEKLDAMHKDVQSMTENILQVLFILKKPSITDEAIRMIKEDELDYDEPKEPFMNTAISEVYKGMYRGFPVAIKRYIDAATSPSEVRRIFHQEVEHMKQFESPNILRMFGMCVKDEKGPNPEFLIIMEYCEHGSLRQFLDSDHTVSWHMKARMCRDAARGLYRLHQSEAKTKVHGSISSSKFLVAEGYTVKLGGFELTQTETSIRKKTRDQSTESVCYDSPQLLHSLENKKDKKSEIYSFGIVMWEIATRQKPFKDLSDKEILQKVLNEKFMEELPDDCPEGLKSLIDSCRNFDEFKRPSVRGLVDKLQILVTQLDVEAVSPSASA
ncbi:mixed lineage kinase domain-like protein [Centropristis striata]|uniref:mixed lineage kinase domain-like protein n=1 Tax=Centropristis striata TaxID=184440 RepID=UPI0027E059A9|nr:mixed lineage kinase domain-like protein [Centropristis striata]